MNLLKTSGLVALSLAAAGTWATAATSAPASMSGSAPLGTGYVQRVSIGTDGSQASDHSDVAGTTPVASATGETVVFWTEAALVPQDTNGLADVYLRSVNDNMTFLVSTGRNGEIGNGDSFEPSVSSNGQFVAFTTTATNLVRRDTNGDVLDAVVKDLRTGKTTVVSRTTSGTQRAKNSFSAVVSGDGSKVAFQSFGSFGKQDDDRREDVYVHDRATGKTQQVSVDSRGRDLPAHYLLGGISEDGRKITFGDDNNAWLRDTETQKSTRLWSEPDHPSQPGAGTVGRPMISGNGRFVVFSTRSAEVVEGDQGSDDDVFRLELATGRFMRVSLAPGGHSTDGESYLPSISHSGRHIAFVSDATNLVAGDDNASPDVFRRDMKKSLTMVASKGASGTADGWSGRYGASISGDGQHVVFRSYAADIVPGDTNGWADIFRWSRFLPRG